MFDDIDCNMDELPMWLYIASTLFSAGFILSVIACICFYIQYSYVNYWTILIAPAFVIFAPLIYFVLSLSYAVFGIITCKIYKLFE